MSHPAPPRIFTCFEWDARPVTRKFATMSATGIVIHHAVTPNWTPLVDEDAERERSFRLARAIQRDHQVRNRWADSGHHFLVARSGLILEGRHGTLAAARRGRCVQAAHAGNSLVNRTYFGIELEGRYDQEYLVTDVQWAFAVQLCAWLAYWGDFDTVNIQPHRKFKPTLCPGLLADHLPDLRRGAHDLKVKILSSVT